MPIRGTVPVSGPLAPTDPSDNYPTHEDRFGIGGWRSVADAAERDSIPVTRRRAGMIVVVRSLGMQMQVLADDLVTWNIVTT